MGRVFEQTMNDIAKASGCDLDFVVEMYNYIFDVRGNVDLKRFMAGVICYDWSARGDGRFENVLRELSDKSGYTYSYLFIVLTDIIYDPCDSSDWKFFVGVTMEHDW